MLLLRSGAYREDRAARSRTGVGRGHAIHDPHQVTREENDLSRLRRGCRHVPMTLRVLVRTVCAPSDTH